MFKERKSSSSKLLCRFPTSTGFKKIIDPIINTKKVVKKIGPDPPILPNYLKELPVEVNPFLDIKMNRIKTLKMAENNRKAYELSLYRDFPIIEHAKRDQRTIFNANYQLKKLKHDITWKEIGEELEKGTVKVNKLPIPREPFISNYDFIVNKREICLLDLAINIKEGQYMELDDIVKEEEDFIRKENKRLRDINEAHNQYLKIIFQNTSDAIKLAEKETFKRNKVVEKVKRAQYNMAHLNAECVKLEEEYLKLKTYKEFLWNCHRQRERKEAMERTSLMNELKIDAILNEVEMDLRTESDESFVDETDNRYRGRKYGTENKNNSIDNPKDFNQNSIETILSYNQTMVDNVKRFEESRSLVFNKNQLEKLKSLIMIGFSCSNADEFSDITDIIAVSNEQKFEVEIIPEEEERELDDNDLNENDLYFNEPQDLVNILSELEANNLSLIENVQEQEEMCDQMKQRIENIKKDMNHQISTINKLISAERLKINNLEDSITCIKETEEFLETFNDLERYKKLFFLDDLKFTTPDEVMDYLHEQISILYHSVFEKVDSTKSNTIEMLKSLEILIDSLYVELQSHDRSVVLKAKKLVDERKREAARLRQKQHCQDAHQLKIQKAMANALMPPRFRYGRKVVFRSEPFKHVLRVAKIDSEVIRTQEEQAFFFSL